MVTPPVSKRNGREEAQGFDEFYQEHYQLVYRAAYSVTHSRQDAEDDLQNVFLNVLRRPEQTELARNIKGFLYRAAVNEGLHILRTRERQRIAGDLEGAEDAAGPAGSPIEDEIRENLADAITNLKPEEAEILILYYEQGYSDAEIAKMLGYSRVKIAVTLYRARANVKKLVHAKQSTLGRRDRASGLGRRFQPEENYDEGR
jgi:RNA polymerase sigma-70 factor, ECF subfamily